MNRALALSVLLGFSACASSGEPDPGELVEDTYDGRADTGRPFTRSYSRYPGDSVRSPITERVVTRMNEIMATRGTTNVDNVFMKVGASGTVSQSLLYCFAGRGVNLDGRDELAPVIDYFREGDAAGKTPFDRVTLAAKVGKTASWVLSGSPSPLDRETAALDPRFAFVNYGTNDMQQGATPAAALPGFYSKMTQLLDELESNGIVPIITGLNPRGDTRIAMQWVPTYEAVTRALAEARQLPYISLYYSTKDLPNMGLGSDRLHGTTYSRGACVFTEAGLQYNYNVRNLLTIQTLDEVWRTTLEGEDAPASEPAALRGDGTRENPFVIDRLPFTHHADTRSPSFGSTIDRYSCSTSNQSGPEVFYSLRVDSSKPVRFAAMDLASTDVDVHLLGSDASCIERGDTFVERTLGRGDYLVAVDTYVSSSRVNSGEYVFVAIECEEGDPRCE